jgi:hypothetical protein
MIGVANRGKSFRALIAYVLRNKDGIDQDPVAWTASRNLPTDDPKLAVSFMNATALRTPSVPEPAYHIAFSFAPEDPVDRTMAERVADHLLARLGLSEHEAVLVAHRDRPHAHVHIVVNRIHPETGRTWRPWHDWQRIRQALSAQERALGLRPVDSHVERVNELASDVRKYERVVELSDELYRAQMDASAARARAAQLEVAGNRADATLTRCKGTLALVYRDPDNAYRAFQAFAEAQTTAAAARAMRENPEQFGALVAVERSRAFGLWHRLDTGPARAAARSAAVAAAEASDAARAWRRAVESEAHTLEQAFERELAGVYQRPTAVRYTFQHVATDSGPEQAAAALRRQPEAFGLVLASIKEDANRFDARVAQLAARGVEVVQARATAKEPWLDARLDAGLTFSRAEIARATGRERAIRVELSKLPGRRALEHRLSAVVGHLLPYEVNVLRTSITAPQRALLAHIRGVVRDIALGREEEPEQARSP